MAHPIIHITCLPALASLALSACLDATPLPSDALPRDPVAETVAELTPHDVDADTRPEEPREVIPDCTDCDDGDPYTQDRCDPDTRDCTHTPCLGPGIGCPCEGPTSDCGHQVCVPSPNLGWLCSLNGCMPECPSGWTCLALHHGADPIFTCLPEAAGACRPCTTQTDCPLGQHCATAPGEPSRCLGSCDANDRCIPGFHCGPALSNGTPLDLCLPDAPERCDSPEP